MKLRRINRAVHRDLGYFLMGMCIIYGISGIALNHRHQWNPNYIIKQQSFELEIKEDFPKDMDKEHVMMILDRVDEGFIYKTHLLSGDNLRVFVEGGTINVNLENGAGNIETIRKRPVFHEVNFLHYNTPRRLWTWFSDFFAAGLIILAITGIFILKGKNGITGRGSYLTISGILIPMLLLYLYMNS